MDAMKISSISDAGKMITIDREGWRTRVTILTSKLRSWKEDQGDDLNLKIENLEFHGSLRGDDFIEWIEADDFIEWIEAIEQFFDYGVILDDRKVKIAAMRL